MVREATLADRADFMRLQGAFQKDQHERGSYFLPTTKNLNLSRAMFEKYATGNVAGFTLLWWPDGGGPPVGILMAGSDTNERDWDVSLGKVAILWSVYVEPSHRGQGITMKLFHHARQIGIGWGYESIVTYVLSTNEHGGRVATEFGTKPVLVEHNVNLVGAMQSPEALAGLLREAV